MAKNTRKIRSIERAVRSEIKSMRRAFPNTSITAEVVSASKIINKSTIKSTNK